MLASRRGDMSLPNASVGAVSTMDANASTAAFAHAGTALVPFDADVPPPDAPLATHAAAAEALLQTAADTARVLAAAATSVAGATARRLRDKDAVIAALQHERLSYELMLGELRKRLAAAAGSPAARSGGAGGGGPAAAAAPPPHTVALVLP